MAKKIDLSGAKEFLFNHGEKVALGTCAVLVLVFGAYGFYRAFGASRTDDGKTWAGAFEGRRRSLETGLASLKDPNIDDAFLNRALYVWNPVTSTYDFTPMGLIAEKEDKGRRNPIGLTIRSGDKDIQIKYVQGISFKYAVDQGDHTVTGLVDAAAAAEPPAKKGDKVEIPPLMNVGSPTRMVVVTAVFPMAQQVEEFRRALKLADQKELFATPEGKEDLPRFYGIDVIRSEIGADGKVILNSEVVIVMRQPDGKLEINPALEKVLREAIYDEDTPALFYPYIYEGLVMPMPKLGNMRYPKFVFPGIDIEWPDDMTEKKNVAGVNPPPVDNKTGTGVVQFSKKPPKKGPNPPPNPMAGGATLKAKLVPEKDLKADKDYEGLAARLFGRDFNIYHVLGQVWTEPAAAGPMPVVPVGPIVGVKGAKKQAKTGDYFSAWEVEPVPKQDPKLTTYPPWERDALVRFIDVDVVPGKTYKYAIQVHIANPNFGKHDKIDFNKAIADRPELSTAANVSPWVETRPIHIPKEHYLYGVDQQLVDELAIPAGPKKGSVLVSEAHAKNIKEYAAFQVHQWVDKRADNVEYAIGDWAILERQLVRRGEYIGLGGFVTVPVWNKFKEAFEVPKTRDTTVKPHVERLGIRIGLIPEAEAPVLVDFVGGRRLRPGASNNFEEDTAVEALVLGADGKLRVLNSREAADPASPVAIEREHRVMSARQRATEVQRGSSSTAMKKPPG